LMQSLKNIPLDIEYEDKHLMVINMPTHMVCV
jgi:23S rRNA-/tRNA-specific pseudouridylate synthase